MKHLLVTSALKDQWFQYPHNWLVFTAVIRVAGIIPGCCPTSDHVFSNRQIVENHMTCSLSLPATLDMWFPVSTVTRFPFMNIYTYINHGTQVGYQNGSRGLAYQQQEVLFINMGFVPYTYMP